jgi:hypothetical protein
VALGQAFLPVLRVSRVGIIRPMLHSNDGRFVFLISHLRKDIPHNKRKAKLSVATFRSVLGTDKLRTGRASSHWSTPQVHRSTCPQHKSIGPLVHSRTHIDPLVHNTSPWNHLSTLQVHRFGCPHQVHRTTCPHHRSVDPLVHNTSPWNHLSTLQVHRFCCPHHKSIDTLVHQVIKFS